MSRKDFTACWCEDGELFDGHVANGVDSIGEVWVTCKECNGTGESLRRIPANIVWLVKNFLIRTKHRFFSHPLEEDDIPF